MTLSGESPSERDFLEGGPEGGRLHREHVESPSVVQDGALDDAGVVRRLFAEFSDRMDGLRLGYRSEPRAVSPEEREANAALDRLTTRLQRAEEDREAVHNLAEHVGAASARIEHLETALREIRDHRVEAGAFTHAQVIAHFALSTPDPGDTPREP